MSFEQLKTPIRKWSICLTLAGLKYRYYDVAQPPTTLIHGTSEYYEDVKAILDISNTSDRYDYRSGISEHSPMNITLATKGIYANNISDPGIVFGRVTKKSVTWYANITSNIGRETTTTAIEIDKNPSALSFPAILHIDGETILADSYSTSPYKLTNITRGVARSLIQTHTFNDASTTKGASSSVITSEICHWRTRVGTIYIAPVYDDGSTGEWIEFFHGFIDSTPQLDDDGLSISFNFAPITALLDAKLTATSDYQSTTSLQHGTHYFSWPNACFAEHAQYVEGNKVIIYATSYDSALNRLFLNDANNNNYNSLWDINHATGVDHPRAGRIKPTATGEGEITDSTATYYEVNLDSTADTLGYTNKSALEVHSTPICGSELSKYGDKYLADWPNDFISSVNDNTIGWTTSTDVADDNGAWINVKVNENQFILENNTNYKEQIHFLYNFGKKARYVIPSDTWSESIWSSGIPVDKAEFAHRLHYPIVFFDENGDIISLSSAKNSEFVTDTVRKWSVGQNTSLSINCAYAKGFYQKKERYIHIRDNIPTECKLKITIPENKISQNSGTYIVRITDVIPLSVGFAAKIHSRDLNVLPSFGDWDSNLQEQDVIIEVIAVFENKSSADLLLELLTSGNSGDSVNGNYDTLPYGLNLPSTSTQLTGSGVWGPLVIVDEDSFLSIVSDDLAENWQLRVNYDDTVRDIVKSVCIATNSTITMQRLANGKCRIKRISTNAATEYESVGSIDNGDWIAEITPHSIIDDNIVTNHEYNVNYDENGENPLKLIFNDNRAIRTHGEGETLQIDLRGVKLSLVRGVPTRDSALELQPLFTRLSYLYGDERIIFKGQIPTYLAVGMQIGSVYKITSQFLKGYNPYFGVTDAVARLIYLEFSLTEENANVEFIYYDRNATGINACMSVKTIQNTTSVTVYNNNFVPLTNIIGTNQIDSDWFAEGDKIYIYAAGDKDNGAYLQIQNKTQGVYSTITFTTPHGFVTGDLPLYIEPDLYSNQSTAHKGLANIASSNNILGSVIPAQEIL